MIIDILIQLFSFHDQRTDFILDLLREFHSDLLLPLVTDLIMLQHLVFLSEVYIIALIHKLTVVMVLIRLRVVFFLHLTRYKHHTVSVAQDLVSW